MRPSLNALALLASSLIVRCAGAAVVPKNATELQDLETRQARAAVITKCTVPGTVALTFDDGPFNYIYDLSATLKRNNAVGTFFFNGNNRGCIYSTENAKRVKFVYDQGHQVASHTWGHKRLETLNYNQLNSEMSRTNEAIQRITGANPAFMRPPYGSYTNLVLQVAAANKQTVVNWDYDSGDSVGKTPAQQKQAYTALAKAKPNTVLALSHETYASSVYEVLPHAINELKKKGYRFVTVAQCLNRAPYTSVGTPAARTASSSSSRFTLAAQGLIVNVSYLRLEMRPTVSRLIRVVPRSSLVVPDKKISNRPRPQSEERKQPTLIDTIIAQREAAGENWPQNIRLEPQLKKADFKAVMPNIRTELKKLMKER